MFTGIITDIGRILALENRGDLRARIATRYNVSGIDVGASIASDGVCLTVVAKGTSSGCDPQGWYEIDISAETVSKTSLAAWVVGKRVNLERSLRVGDELGGHIVSGHVDGVATIVSMMDDGASTRVTLQAPKDLERFIAPKGSVALNGTSLTINEVIGAQFGINFIPHTKSVTTWGDAKIGDPVNLEVDTMARYVARLRDYD
ncbi:MAG: riboflavin synthase [Octadecabacter sp.]|nr:riboflavin synthase [Octadecabacter sp.]